MTPPMILLAAVSFLFGALTGAVAESKHRDNAPSDASCIDAAAQSEAACQAVAERLSDESGARLVMPPWLPMTLAPTLDAR